MRQIIMMICVIGLMASCSTVPDTQVDLRAPVVCDYSPCLGEAEFATAELPMEILDYISTNYSDQTIDEAEVLGCEIVEIENENEQEGENENDHEDVYTGSVEDIAFYVVELSNGSELLFDAAGSFIAEQIEEEEGNDEEDETEDEDEDETEDEDEDETEDEDEDEDDDKDDEPLVDLLENTATYLADNYGSFVIEDVDLDTEFGLTYYSVELEDDTNDLDLEVFFDSDGNFLCEK